MWKCNVARYKLRCFDLHWRILKRIKKGGRQLWPKLSKRYILFIIFNIFNQIFKRSLNAIDKMRNCCKRLKALVFMIETCILSIIIHEYPSMSIRVLQKNKNGIISISWNMSICPKGKCFERMFLTIPYFGNPSFVTLSPKQKLIVIVSFLIFEEKYVRQLFESFIWKWNRQFVLLLLFQMSIRFVGYKHILIWSHCQVKKPFSIGLRCYEIWNRNWRTKI